MIKFNNCIFKKDGYAVLLGRRQEVELRADIKSGKLPGLIFKKFKNERDDYSLIVVIPFSRKEENLVIEYLEGKENETLINPDARIELRAIERKLGF